MTDHTPLVIWDDEIVEFSDVNVVDWTYLRQEYHQSDSASLIALRDSLLRYKDEGAGDYIEEIEGWIAELAADGE